MKNLNNPINLIEKVDYAGLETSSGNCGMFALALREVLGSGDLVFVTNGSSPEYATDDDAEENLMLGEPDIWHVALKVGDKLYDGTGEITIDDLDEIAYREYGDVEPFLTVWSDVNEPEFYKIIRNNTNWFIDKDEFVNAMIKN